MSWKMSNTSYFKSGYKLLPRQIQDLAKGVFEIMENDPYDPILRTHRLRRPLANYHAISVNHEYRIICRIYDAEKEIILHDIGTHEVYAK
jgi:mRNA-degrading endonuclease RelE of RelBE toxin-antitoxin system